jgi:hypothetical protein
VGGECRAGNSVRHFCLAGSARFGLEMEYPRADKDKVSYPGFVAVLEFALSANFSNDVRSFLRFL